MSVGRPQAMNQPILLFLSPLVQDWAPHPCKIELRNLLYGSLSFQTFHT